MWELPGAWTSTGLGGRGPGLVPLCPPPAHPRAAPGPDRSSPQHVPTQLLGARVHSEARALGPACGEQRQPVWTSALLLVCWRFQSRKAPQRSLQPSLIAEATAGQGSKAARPWHTRSHRLRRWHALPPRQSRLISYLYLTLSHLGQQPAHQTQPPLRLSPQNFKHSSDTGFGHSLREPRNRKS